MFKFMIMLILLGGGIFIVNRITPILKTHKVTMSSSVGSPIDPAKRHAEISKLKLSWLDTKKEIVFVKQQIIDLNNTLKKLEIQEELFRKELEFSDINTTQLQRKWFPNEVK